ncbi:hypothetical protein [Streptomyces sp. NPDC048639]|uniref:hypothetical protein n=1 Tax=Streptomyces sp. NPDC048639 TaxID=3365581 RepID=UPI00371FBF98
MHRGITALTVAATAVAVCAGCTKSVTPSDHAPASSRSAGEAGALGRLPEVVAADAPLAMEEIPVPAEKQRILGEVYSGGKRIIAYTGGQACGLLVLRSSTSRERVTTMKASWPTESSVGSSILPMGPYSTATSSNADDKGSWTSLSCAKDAMVIEYASDRSFRVTRTRGAVSTVRLHGRKNDLAVVVGEKSARSRIMARLTRHS